METLLIQKETVSNVLKIVKHANHQMNVFLVKMELLYQDQNSVKQGLHQV